MNKQIRQLLTMGLLLLPLVGLSQQPNSSTSSPSSAEGQMSVEDLRIFVRVFEQLRQAYVEELSDAELFEMAIWGMLAELDPHSEFLDLEAISELEDSTEGRFQGIGVELTMEEEYLIIVTPIDGSPAQRAGIEPGDIILRINGESIEGLSFRQSLQKLDGKSGEPVLLTLDRLSERNAVEVELVRERIAVESVQSRVVAEDIGYLRIAQFQQDTGREFEKELRELIQDNPLLAGLIIDLRNNPGGLLHSSVEITDLFLDTGLIVSTKGRLEFSNQEFYATPGELGNELPLVVLINRGSASAAEIVAGALQDHERAIILGDTSFGKGSVQEILNVDKTRAIKLTIALYYTPSGRSIQAQGIYPDIRVDRGSIDWDRDENSLTEASLSGHLNNASGSNSSAGADADAEGPELIGMRETLSDIEDVQLAHAVSLLQGNQLLNRQAR